MYSLSLSHTHRHTHTHKHKHTGTAVFSYGSLPELNGRHVHARTTEQHATTPDVDPDTTSPDACVYSAKTNGLRLLYTQFK